MALGEDEPVVVRVLGVFRVEPHDREEQGGDDVCCRAATRRMPAAGFGRGANAQDPQPGGVVIQGGDQGIGGDGRGWHGELSFILYRGITSGFSKLCCCWLTAAG